MQVERVGDKHHEYGSGAGQYPDLQDNGQPRASGQGLIHMLTGQAVRTAAIGTIRLHFSAAGKHGARVALWLAPLAIQLPCAAQGKHASEQRDQGEA